MFFGIIDSRIEIPTMEAKLSKSSTVKLSGNYTIGSIAFFSEEVLLQKCLHYQKFYILF